VDKEFFNDITQLRHSINMDECQNVIEEFEELEKLCTESLTAMVKIIVVENSLLMIIIFALFS
jgi:hypothetical protein